MQPCSHAELQLLLFPWEITPEDFFFNLNDAYIGPLITNAKFPR